jgi:alpha-tubulin suppressor-like RCC1 family protein
MCLGDEKARCLPTEVPNLSNLVAVQGGGGEVVWLTYSGTVYTCGGVLTGDFKAPVKVLGLPAGDAAVSISVGNAYATALLSDGEIWNWDVGGAGQLGHGSVGNSVSPVQGELPAGTHAIQVYAGGAYRNDGHQLALLNTGEVVAWGATTGATWGRGPRKRRPLQWQYRFSRR